MEKHDSRTAVRFVNCELNCGIYVVALTLTCTRTFGAQQLRFRDKPPLSHIVIHIFFRSAPFESGATIFMRNCLKFRRKVVVLYQKHNFSLFPVSAEPLRNWLQPIDFVG